ncbi:NAD-dependent epimerase/dehydratase family protein [Psychrobacillus psychrodurans]|uniref:NAD-dependent epimerase/dehydratase family protein n=1 Tax=Psychrobacillus psychrodurans TaxID=126157 RepID=A0A9X3LCT7_9BACI|nr:NAD-dependent epimerase/dehydratase family protein [Psychrobacillus psychrodurans]MCZ8535452.1 NAD-dependent epimerase/dehydratase family protein [Psychrobacillus psychrodurans]
MKVLVTGAAGFIGSYVVRALLEQRFTVVAVDNLSTGKQSNLSYDTQFYEIDITNNDLERIFEYEQPDYVIHLAAQSSVFESMIKPMEDCQSNLVGTLNILRFSNQYNVKKCIFASTAAVYGNPTTLPINEDSKLAPLSFYALSKLSAEKYVQLYEKLFGLKSCILRFSNVYGPLQAGGVITKFLDCIINRKNPVIFGGNQTRDFIYVKDVAVACVKSLLADQTGVFNISSSTEISIQQVYEKLTELTDVQSKPSYDSLGEGEIVRSILSNKKATFTFEWEPSYSFVAGLEETIHHYTQLKQI